MPDIDDLREATDFTSSRLSESAFTPRGAHAQDWGIRHRLNRIFDANTGRTAVVAFDHGYFQGPTWGIEQLEKAIVPLLGDSDAIMLTRGALRTSIPPHYRGGVILRASGGPSILSKLSDEHIAVSLEDAQRYFQNARYALFQVIGLDPEQQHYAIVFPDTMAYLEVRLDQETVLRELDRQPELRSTDRSQEAAQAGVRQARSTLFPALQIELYPQDYGGGFNRFGFQIGLKLPLWMLPNHRGSVQMAQAEARRWSWQR